MSATVSVPQQVGLLLGHDARRFGAAVRRPRPGVWLSALLPLLLVGGALAAAGADALPDAHEAGGAVGLGFLASAPLAFLAYGVLFRPVDDPFLRRLGVAPAALYVERALRLLGIAVGVALLLMLPLAVAAAPLARPAAVLLASAVGGWGAALLALAAAARTTAEPDRKVGIASRMMGPDRELVRVGPLVYAPLAPLIAAIVVSGWIGAAPGAGWARAAMVAGLGVLCALVAVRPFALALPRFAPQALEMAFAPPPEAGDAGLALDRGVPRLLPLRPRAVWVRDAVVTARRYRWATTLVWPVAILSAVALARWGALPQVRAWVLAAGALTLAAQGAAVIALGRLERSGPGWLDHAAGLRVLDRWLGRWAFGFGLTLWLVVPLGLAWGLWAGAGSGWLWVGAGIATAAVAAGASLAAAGR
jgi:hypothetical protein